MKSYISLEEGIKILDENIENNKFVKVKLIEAIGLKSFENVYLNKRLPPLDRKISFVNNICLEGEDIEKGDLLIEKGKIIDYADIGILASIGIEKIKVYRKPKIGIFTTGDEIIDIDKPLIDGKIYNSNKYLLLGRLKEMNLDTIVLDNKKDDIIEVGNNLKKLSEKVDLIITTGGI